MIKTFLIFLLTVILLAVAFFTRPSEENFRQYMTGPAQRTAETPLGRVTLEIDPPVLGQRYEFKDRWLWTTVEQDGEVMYVGLFANWIRWSDEAARPQSDEQRLVEQAPEETQPASPPTADADD